MHPAPFDPRDISPAILVDRCESYGISKTAMRRLLGAVMGGSAESPLSWLERGLVSREFASRCSDLATLKLEKRARSAIDNFEKVLFRTADGLAVESVIIPLHKQGKVSLCLSSQVGCVMGCVFCATARMPTRRNLQTWEIVDQYIQCRTLVRQSGREVSGAVFMGMGEPFLNYERVLAAAELFSFPVAGAIASKAITISTVGLVDKIDRFTEERRRFRLSISLGAATDEKRAKLVPVAGRTPIVELMAAARRYALSRRTRINLAYVCISGENVGIEDARMLGEVIADTPVRLDLIDVNDSSGRFSPPSAEELKQFRDALSKYVAQPVVRRYSGGKDIQAACGTLAGELTTRE